MAVPWSEIAAHRERLVRIAARRCPSREDAEDVVHEAMVRSATFDDLDPDRVAQFLTAVTLRLCADLYRTADRGARALRRLDTEEVPGPEAALVAAAEAAELRELLASLPPRQRSVLVDRAAGMSVTQISSRHSLTYKATESALSRARSAMRLALASGMALVAAALSSLRRRPAVVVALPLTAVAVVTMPHEVPMPAPVAAPPAVVAPFEAPEASRPRVVRVSSGTAAVAARVPRPAAPRDAAVARGIAKEPGGRTPREVVYYDPPGEWIPRVSVEDDDESPRQMLHRCTNAERYEVTVRPKPTPQQPYLDVYCRPSSTP